MVQSSSGRALDRCEGCGLEFPPSQLQEMPEALTEVKPYPETLRLCPPCVHPHTEFLADQRSELMLQREERGEQ
jgi:hypothetical protein